VDMNYVHFIKKKLFGKLKERINFNKIYIFIFSADDIERNQQLEFERNIEKLQIMKVKISENFTK